MFTLQNRIAIITGAGSGIGEAIAETFSQQHAEVFLLDLNGSQVQRVAEALRAKGAKAHALEVDVTQPTSVAGAISKIIERVGRIDILVNSAGISHIGKIENTSSEDFDKVFQVNVKGVYHLIREVLPHFQKQQKGIILNICSIAATVGLNDRFAYSMSKGAVLSMTLSIAKDYLTQNIRCNCISPARVHTSFVDNFLAKNYPGKEQEMFDKLSKSQPIGRMGKPEEVAALALYLCSEEASFITGTDYPLDGGFLKLNS